MTPLGLPNLIPISFLALSPSLVLSEIKSLSSSATIENMVYELLLKSGKNLNSKIEKKDSFYKINNNELVLLLEKASQEIIDSVIVEKPIKVIALDKLFKGNDQLKTNTVLQMKDAGIEFKTI